jgi:hypothetical protein
VLTAWPAAPTPPKLRSKVSVRLTNENIRRHPALEMISQQ